MGQKLDVESLLAALHDADPHTRWNAVRDLGEHCANQQVVSALLDVMSSRDLGVAVSAARTLAPTRRPEVLEKFWEYLRSADEHARYVAVHGLWAARESGIISVLIKMLDHEHDALVRLAIVDSLAESKDPEIAEPLIRLLEDSSNGELVLRAIDGLAKLGVRQAFAPLVGLLSKPEYDHRVCGAAVEALIQLDGAGIVPELLNVLGANNRNAAGRMVAARTLGELQEKQATPRLIAALQHVSSRTIMCQACSPKLYQAVSPKMYQRCSARMRQ